MSKLRQTQRTVRKLEGDGLRLRPSLPDSCYAPCRRCSFNVKAADETCPDCGAPFPMLLTEPFSPTPPAYPDVSFSACYPSPQKTSKDDNSFFVLCLIIGLVIFAVGIPTALVFGAVLLAVFALALPIIAIVAYGVLAVAAILWAISSLRKRIAWLGWRRQVLKDWNRRYSEWELLQPENERLTSLAVGCMKQRELATRNQITYLQGELNKQEILRNALFKPSPGPIDFLFRRKPAPPVDASPIGEPEKREALRKATLDMARDTLLKQIEDCSVFLVKIELIRWSNLLEPIADARQQNSESDAQCQKNTALSEEIRQKGQNLVRQWEGHKYRANPDVIACVEKLKKMLKLAAELQESLLDRRVSLSARRVESFSNDAFREQLDTSDSRFDGYEFRLQAILELDDAYADLLDQFNSLKARAQAEAEFRPD